MKKNKIEWVSCHRKPERSFFYRGRQFPVCARCTGIYIGYISIFIFAIFRIHLPVLCSILFIIPTVLDGATQAFCTRESNNILRLFTGILFGVGISSLLAVLAKNISFYLLNFIYLLPT